MARSPRRTHAAGRALSLMAVLCVALALPSSAFAAPPSNDDFANAKVIIGTLPYTDTIDPSDSSTQVDEPESECTGDVEASVWYRFTPVRSGTFRVDTLGSDYDAAVDVYRGTTLAGLVLVDCNDDIDSNNGDLLDARLAFRATGGVRYYIRIHDGPGDLLQVRLRSVNPPANDNFGRARTIYSLPFDANADNLNATSQTNEPRQSNACTVMRATRWYKYTPASDEMIWANTFVAADNDTVLAVYRGNKLDNAVEIACNDDQWVANGRIYASGVTFKALAGVTYRFQVGGYEAESGSSRELPFHVRRITAEPNDNFASATNIVTYPPFRDPVNLRQTSIEANEPISCTNGAANTAWYKVTASATEQLTARVEGPSDVSPFVTVYEATGPGFAGLAVMDCGDNVPFEAVMGTTYYFQVALEYAVTAPLEFWLQADV